MKPCTPALKALLDNWSPRDTIRIAPLYTFTLTTGEVLRYSGFQTAVSAPAAGTNTPLFEYPLGPVFKPTRTKTQIGTEVDVLTVDIGAGPDDLVGAGTLTWQAAAHAGLFDGATCQLDRAYITAAVVGAIYCPTPVVGTLTWFYGRVADVEIGRTRLVIRVKSLLDLLTIQMPRRIFQSACTHIFGGPMCLFDRSTLAANITAVAGSSAAALLAAITPSPTTLYDQGTIIGTSGANMGFTRTVGRLDSSGSPSVIYQLKPWLYPVTAGDGFQLLPGCDHTLATCDGTFGNSAHFGGFPDIPPPENAA